MFVRVSCINAEMLDYVILCSLCLLSISDAIFILMGPEM